MRWYSAYLTVFGSSPFLKLAINPGVGAHSRWYVAELPWNRASVRIVSFKKRPNRLASFSVALLIWPSWGERKSKAAALCVCVCVLCVCVCVCECLSLSLFFSLCLSLPLFVSLCLCVCVHWDASAHTVPHDDASGVAEHVVEVQNRAPVWSTHCVQQLCKLCTVHSICSKKKKNRSDKKGNGGHIVNESKCITQLLLHG